MLKHLKVLALGALLASTTLTLSESPASAQVSTSASYGFLTAVKERDGGKATQLLNAPGSTVVNSRDDRGEGALHLLAKGRDSEWLSFLLGRGANANLQSNSGESPLLVAARIGWVEGADVLMRYGAKPDLANRLGETPLIVAVQARQVPVVRRLLEAGANPDKRDNASGRSARDYAKLSDRGGDLTKLITNTVAKTKPKVIAGPKL
jgi:ankyrin repeat protein